MYGFSLGALRLYPGFTEVAAGPSENLKNNETAKKKVTTNSKFIRFPHAGDKKNSPDKKTHNVKFRANLLFLVQGRRPGICHRYYLAISAGNESQKRLLATGERTGGGVRNVEELLDQRLPRYGLLSASGGEILGPQCR